MTIETLIKSIPTFIDSVLVPLVFALAFIAFLWGVYTYFIAGAANEEQRETGRKFVMWSIIGFVIMLSLGGIIMVLQNSLGLKPGTRTCLPSVTGDCVRTPEEQRQDEDSWLNDPTRDNECSPNIPSSCPTGQSCSQVGPLGEWICI